MWLFAVCVGCHFVSRRASNVMCVMLKQIRLAKPKAFATQAQFRRSQRHLSVHIANGTQTTLVGNVLPYFVISIIGHVLFLASSVK